MAEGPDVRALRWILESVWGVRRPTSCPGCPFATRRPPGRGVNGCALLALPEVNHQRPPCTTDHWRERARIELDLLECDNAALTAVARDAREESLMYRRGLAEGAAAERERCCKAVCADCAAGVAAAFDAYSGGWWHGNPAAVSAPGVEPARPCKADAIRGRAEEDGR